MHNCQHLFVMDLVVPFHIREAFWHKAYWVEEPIFLLLQQDGSHGEVGCITLQVEEAGVGGILVQYPAHLYIRVLALIMHHCHCKSKIPLLACFFDQISETHFPHSLKTTT